MVVNMRGSRHEPEGFAEDMAELLDLQRKRRELDEAIDEKFIEITVEKRASTSSVAELLGVKPPVVTVRRQNALKRQQARQRRLGSAA